MTPKGFTLVELLVVVSIISALSSMAIVSNRTLKLKAVRVGLLSNLNVARALILSWEADNDNGPDLTNPAICPNNQKWVVPGTGYEAGWNACFLTSTTTDTGCVGTNPFGLGLNNCNNKYSSYIYLTQRPSSLKHWVISTGVVGLSDICPSATTVPEVVQINRCGRKCSVFQITSLAPCAYEYVWDKDCPGGGPVVTNFANCE